LREDYSFHFTDEEMKPQRMETFSPMQQSWRGTRWDAKCTFSPDSGLRWWLSSTESACQFKRRRFNPWVEKIPWRRKWQPTGNPMDRRAWWATVHGVTKSRTQLSD